MAFSLGWAGAPVPDFDDSDHDFSDGAAGRQQDRYSESEDDEGLNQARNRDPSNAGIGASVDKSKGKRKRSKKGGPSKRVSLDYDSDDGRIIELKKQGHSDDYVAQKFKEEGRIQYEAKTINSRWIRLRKLLTQQEDERLDDELSDWHEGEDDQLDEIVKAVTPKFDHQIQLLEQRKWHEISLHFAEKLGKRKYTGKACRERTEAIDDGTALPPIEQAANPEERRQMREDRIAAAKKARQDAKDAQKAKEQRAEARAAAKKQEAEEANARKIENALQKRAEKEEAERIKEERKENKERMKQHRITMLAQFRNEKEWIKTRKQAEKDLYRQLTGYSINSSHPGRRRKGKDAFDSEEEAELVDDFESDDEDMADLDEDESGDDGLAEDPDSEAEFERQITAAAVQEEEADDSDEEDDQPLAVRKAKKAIPATQAGHVPAAVTKATLLNPRSIMSSAELTQLLFFRRLSRRGPDETHAEVVARIAASDDSLKSEELSQLLLHLSEKSKGKKSEKIARLQEADARGSDAGQMGTRSTDLDFIRRYDGYKGGFEYLITEIERERQAGEMAGGMEIGK